MNHIKLLVAIILFSFCFNKVVIAQTDSAAAFEKELSIAKNDTVKGYYHRKLFWEYYLQPKKFVYHYIEGAILPVNEWSDKEGYFSVNDFSDSCYGIKREFEGAVKLYHSKNDKMREAAALEGLTAFTDDNSEAIKNYHQEEQLLMQINNPLIPRWLEVVRFNLMMRNTRGNDPKIVIPKMKNQIDIFLKSNQNLTAYYLIGSLGSIYGAIDKYDSAVYYETQSFQYLQKIGVRKEELLKKTASIVRFYDMLDKYAPAKYYVDYCEKYLPDIAKFKRLTILIETYLAEYYINIKDRKNAQEYLDKSKAVIDAYKGVDKAECLKIYYAEYAFLGKQFGDYKLAFDNEVKARDIYDSLNSALNIKEFNDLQIKYEVAQKEKDIVVAAQQNKLQKTWFIVGVVFLVLLGFGGFIYVKNSNKINQLKKLVEVRNIIAANLHDEVGSTLGSVVIMSKMAQQKDATEKDTMLGTISNNSQSMLETMRDIVWSINPENDKLENLVARLKLFAAETLEAQNIDVVFTVDEKALSSIISLEKRKDLYLIFKEAIINIAKYSKASQVVFELKEDSNKLHFSIKDNGVGMPENIVVSMGGNGLKNMQSRAEKIGAAINIQSKENSGTSISLTIQTT